jgi:cytosine/adenosine deaminase-related metal-dependent hydrolase
MGTINGAKALGIEKSIGSLEVGKKVDFVVVNPRSLHCAPWDPKQLVKSHGACDPVTVIVHSCTGENVQHVVIDGRQIIVDAEMLIADEGEIVERAIQSAAALRKRAGIKARTHLGLNYV